MFLHVFPITDGLSVALHDVLDDIAHEFDEDGTGIWWDDLGDPRKCGRVYREARTEERARQDEEDLKNYVARVGAYGGDATRHRRDLIEQVVQELGLQGLERPYLVFWLKEPRIDPLCFPIPRVILGTDLGRTALKEFLLRTFSHKQVLAILTPHLRKPAHAHEALSAYLQQASDQLQAWCEKNLPVLSPLGEDPEVVERPGGWKAYPKLGWLALNDDAQQVELRGAPHALSSSGFAILKAVVTLSKSGARPLKHAEIMKAAKMPGEQLRDKLRSDKLLRESLIRPCKQPWGHYALCIDGAAGPRARRSRALRTNS